MTTQLEEFEVEQYAIELMAVAAESGYKMTLPEARAGAWLAFLALSDVLESRGGLSKKAKELRKEVLA